MRKNNNRKESEIWLGAQLGPSHIDFPHTSATLHLRKSLLCAVLIIIQRNAGMGKKMGVAKGSEGNLDGKSHKSPTFCNRIMNQKERERERRQPNGIEPLRSLCHMSEREEKKKKTDGTPSMESDMTHLRSKPLSLFCCVFSSTVQCRCEDERIRDRINLPQHYRLREGFQKFLELLLGT